jgi:hypothetical protein
MMTPDRITDLRTAAALTGGVDRVAVDELTAEVVRLRDVLEAIATEPGGDASTTIARMRTRARAALGGDVTAAAGYRAALEAILAIEPRTHGEAEIYAQIEHIASRALGPVPA